MKKPETKFKEKVLEDLKKLRELGVIWVIKTQEVGRSGTPDLLICARGLFIAIELKVDADIEPLQNYNLNKIQKAGGLGWTVNPKTWSHYLTEINKIVRRRN